MSQGQLSEVEELSPMGLREGGTQAGSEGESCRQRWWAHCAASAVVGWDGSKETEQDELERPCPD